MDLFQSLQASKSISIFDYIFFYFRNVRIIFYFFFFYNSKSIFKAIFSIKESRFLLIILLQAVIKSIRRYCRFPFPKAISWPRIKMKGEHRISTPLRHPTYSFRGACFASPVSSEIYSSIRAFNCFVVVLGQNKLAGEGNSFKFFVIIYL